jgi:hypothetical protein
MKRFRRREPFPIISRRSSCTNMKPAEASEACGWNRFGPTDGPNAAACDLLRQQPEPLSEQAAEVIEIAETRAVRN